MIKQIEFLNKRNESIYKFLIGICDSVEFQILIDAKTGEKIASKNFSEEQKSLITSAVEMIKMNNRLISKFTKEMYLDICYGDEFETKNATNLLET